MAGHLARIEEGKSPFTFLTYKSTIKENVRFYIVLINENLPFWMSEYE